jgi:DNA (cytosine-5)-methyltransferase 1
MDHTHQPVRHLSVCSGYEGIGLGLRRVFPGLREIAHVEGEAWAISNLVSKAEEGKIYPAPVWTDVKTFPFRQFRGKVDILSGGFPCQPFSVAGGRQGVSDERHLYPFISAGIRECQPTIVFLENVPGIISTKLPDGTPVLQYVLRDLEGMGYTATAGIFSAEEVSAPHRRDRVFVLAYAQSSGRTKREPATQGSGSQTHRPSQRRSQAGELADTDNSRGREDREPSQLRTDGTQQSPSHPGGDREGEDVEEPGRGWEINTARWPARPGQEQHEWEEPRTIVDNTQRKRSQGSDGDAAVTDRDQPQDGVPTQAGQHNDSQAQPELGGATDGIASGVDPTLNRVDRLRLIGNGVVPETAERAYRVLAERLRGEL